jgi:hypothetical protein
MPFVMFKIAQRNFRLGDDFLYISQVKSKILIALKDVRSYSNPQVVFPDGAPKLSIYGVESELIFCALLLRLKAIVRFGTSNDLPGK